MKKLLSILFLGGACLTASAAPAVYQLSNDAVWPATAAINSGTPGDPFALSGGGTSIIDYESERDVKDNRTLFQTFSVGGAGLEVTDLYIGYVGGTGINDTFELRIFEVDDVHGRGSDADDDQILGFPTGSEGGLNTIEIYNELVYVTTLVTLATDPIKVLHLSVNGLTLPARTGPAGYGLSLFNPDTDGVFPFKWAIERSDALSNAANMGPYLGGRGYSDNAGSAEENHDWAFAIDGTPIPEPATTALIVLTAVLGWVGLRRRDPPRMEEPLRQYR
ncbi:MAG: PEP-CTERM sorting domain-containing protein [Oceanipulchritudo sp.]